MNLYNGLVFLSIDKHLFFPKLLNYLNNTITLAFISSFCHMTTRNNILIKVENISLLHVSSLFAI